MSCTLRFISNPPFWMSRPTAAGHLYISLLPLRREPSTSALKLESHLQVAPVEKFPGSYCWTFSLSSSIIRPLNYNVLDDASSNVDSESTSKPRVFTKSTVSLMLSANMATFKNSARIVPCNCCSCCPLNTLTGVKHTVCPHMFVQKEIILCALMS